MLWVLGMAAVMLLAAVRHRRSGPPRPPRPPWDYEVLDSASQHLQEQQVWDDLWS